MSSRRFTRFSLSTDVALLSVVSEAFASGSTRNARVQSQTQ